MGKILLTQRSYLCCFCNLSGEGHDVKQNKLSENIKRKLFVVFAVIFMLQYSVQAATKTTTTAGPWNTGTNWNTAGVPASGDIVNVNHTMAINTNIAVSAGGYYTINAPAIDAAGGTAYTINVGGFLLGGFGTLDVKSTMTFEGALNVTDFGRVYVRNGAVLTVGAATFAALSDIIVDEGGTLIVNGNMLVYGNAPQINGDLIVNGNYTGDALSTLYGTGTMKTTGSVSTILTGTVFGNLLDCAASCTYTFCTNTATISPASGSVCSGASTTLTGTLSPTTIGTITYQWQSGVSATGPFSNISGATASTYNAGPAASIYYRVRITQSGCTATSSAVSITVVPIPTITSTTPAARCGNGSIALGATASAGTVYWYAASTGGISIASGNSYSPSVTGTTTYYVSATTTTGGCTTASRTAVVATVNPIPAITSVISGSRCGPGTVALSAVASAGTINWYDASVAGTLVNTGTAYNPSVSTTTIYYVDASAIGCTTASRTAVTATVTPCAVIWTGAVNTNWDLAGNWNLAFVPTSINSVTIPSGAVQPTISASSTAAAVTINSGATLTISGTGVLNAYGNIANSGTLTTVAGSTVVFAGSSPQTITGVPSLYNVQVTNAAGVSVLSALTLNGTLTLSSGIVTTNSNLTVNFDNGGNIGYNVSDAGSISGNVTGRRDGLIRTHYIAAPFSGVTSAQIGATTPLYYNNYWKLYWRDFASQGWISVTSATEAMPLGTGFSLAFPTTSSLIMTGTYNHSYALTGAGYSNTVSNKYILVANPYPSTLDWTSTGFTKTNVANAIYLWSASTNQSSSWVAGIGTGPNGTQYIPAMQSFLVRVTGSGGTSSVSINNTARISNQNPSFARIASDAIVRIKILTEDHVLWDDAVVRFNESATTDFDFDLDAYKVLNYGLAPSIYTTINKTQYSINSVASPTDLPNIPISIKLPADGNYQLIITQSDPSIEYTLLDKKNGTENIISGPAYVFSGQVADEAGRFELKLKTAVVTNVQSSNTAQGLRINSSTKGFVIQTEEFAGETATVEISDMTGNIIKTISTEHLGGGATYIHLGIPEGAYLVHVTVLDKKFTGLISIMK